MSKKEDTAYQEWIDEIRTKLPAELHTNLDALIGTDVGKEIFRGGLREADYYKRLNEHNTAKAKFDKDVKEQADWFAVEQPKNVALIAEVNKLRKDLLTHKAELIAAGLEVPPEVTKAVDQSQGASVQNNSDLEQIKRQLQFLDKALPQVIGKAMALTARLTRENYSVDPNAVFQHAAENGVDLDAAFETLTATERNKRSEVKREEEIKAAKEEGAREALAKLSGPDRAMRPAGPSVFDTMNATKDTANAPVSDKNVRRDIGGKELAELFYSGPQT